MTTDKDAAAQLNQIRWRRWRLDKVVDRITDLARRGELDQAARERIAEALRVQVSQRQGKP